MSERAICSFFWANCSFTHFWANIEWFARKTDERIPSPASTPVSRIFSLLLPQCQGFSLFFYSSVKKFSPSCNLGLKFVPLLCIGLKFVPLLPQCQQVFFLLLPQCQEVFSLLLPQFQEVFSLLLPQCQQVFSLLYSRVKIFSPPVP